MNKFLGDNIYHIKLENNLNVYYVEKKGFEKKYAAISTNYGSNDLIFKDKNGEVITLNHGIAHFLEHKMFEQPDGTDAFAKFAEYGSSANAFTNFHMTSYLFSTTDDFYPSLEHLLSYVSQPHFTDENVAKEQGIIEQEIKMYEDNADWRVFFNTLKAMYINHPNAIDIAGTVESINKITKEELYKCYETFYSPSNMVLSIVGDLDWQMIQDTIKKVELNDYMQGEEIQRIDIDEPNEVATKNITQEMSVSIPMFSLGYKDKTEHLSEIEMVKRGIATNIILKAIFGKGSELDAYLKDNHLIFDSLSYGFTSKNNYGYTIIAGESRDIEKTVEIIKKEICKFIKNKISEEEFNRIKKSTLGKVIRVSDSIEGLADLVANSHFEGLAPSEKHQIMKSITLEDVNYRLKNLFDEDMSVLSVIKPLGDNNE